MSGHIDVHHHAVPPGYRRALQRAGIETVAGVPFPAWQPDQSYERMATLGISRALLSLSAPGPSIGDRSDWPSVARDANAELAGLRDGDPARFGMLAALPLPDVDAALNEITHVYDTLQADGLIMLTNYHGVYLTDPLFEPVLSELDRRQAVVLVHPTIPVPLREHGLGRRPGVLEFTFDTTRVAADLIVNGALDRYPGIRWILAHLGGTLPFVSWRLSMVEMTPPGFWSSVAAPGATLRDYLRRFYYDTAMNAGPHQLALVAGQVGADRLLYGSDTPFGPDPFIDATTAALQNAGLTPDERIAVAYGNAQRLFALEPDTKRAGSV